MTILQPQSIVEKLMYAVKRIEVSGNGQSWVGTGYTFTGHIQGDTFTPLIITNRHVLQDAEHINVLFHTVTQNNEGDEEYDGDYIFLDLHSGNASAVFHPNPNVDLGAILPGQALRDWSNNQGAKRLYWMGIRPEEIVSDQTLEDIDACEYVTMVGCPNGLWDEENGFPLFRRGVTASHPAIDYNGNPEFAVDIGVYSGASGSPVFLYEQGLIRPSKTATAFQPGTRFGLLGTLWGGPRISENGEVVVESVPTNRTNIDVRTDVRMHLGYVIKAREIYTLLEKIVK